MPMPVASTRRSPTESMSRPVGNAKTIRRNANALMTEAAAALPTPKSRANTGSAGATMPKPSATKNATTTSTPTSRGRSARGERGTRSSSPAHPDAVTHATARRQESTRSVSNSRRQGPSQLEVSLRRLVQVGALLTLAVSGVMLGGSFTAADATGTQSTKPGVLQAAWFWQNAYEQTNPPVAAGPLPTTEPSGVPEGDLAVAHTGNDATSSKMAVLAFDIGTISPGSFVDKFTFSVTVDSDPQATNTPNPAVVACLPTRLWPATMASDYTDEPTVDCSTKVAPKVDGNTYTFQIPQIAQRWIDDQNLGVALVNDPDNTSTPFQVVFTGAKTVKATMSYTPGTTTPPVSAPVTNTGTGTTSSVGSTGTSRSTSKSPAVGDVPPAPGVVTGGDNAQPPQVAAPSTPQLKPVAHASAASSMPGRAFWLGAAAFALLLLLMSVVLGAEQQPVGAGGGSRLDRVLRGSSGDRSALASDS